MEITDPPSGFVRGYHLTSFDHGVSNIGLQRLKVARFSEVNDPFELFACDVKKRQSRTAVIQFKEELDRTHGLLCFSKHWKNPVLWSHYATGGRGLALGFEIDSNLGEQGVLDVEYEDEKLKVFRDSEPPIITPALQKLLLVTKFKHWAYEEECRVLVPLSESTREARLYFYPFSDKLRLREVVLGPLCSAQVVASVRALAQRMSPGVQVRAARLGYKWFEVKEETRVP
jgi:hypothetical protein